MSAAADPNHRLSHLFFVVMLLGKGAIGLGQLVIAVGIGLGLGAYLPAMSEWLLSTNWSQHANAAIAAPITAFAHDLPKADVTFYGIYFLVHGLLHVTVVWALLKQIERAYPAAILTLVGFIVYQMVEWWHVGGMILPVLSLIDVFVIYLTVVEWRVRHPKAPA